MLGANMVSEESFSPASRITHWAVGGAERRLRVHPNSSCSRIDLSSDVSLCTLLFPLKSFHVKVNIFGKELAYRTQLQ